MKTEGDPRLSGVSDGFHLGQDVWLLWAQGSGSGARDLVRAWVGGPCEGSV